MSPVAIWPAVGCFFLAILTAAVLRRLFGMPAQGTAVRETSIDGLRGILAFAVFLHHVPIWYYLLHTHGEWREPPSAIFVHLGQSSVAMFFMITAYLFWSRLLASRESGIDWTRLYVSRVMRLTPLYLFAVAALFVFVAAASGFELRESAIDLVENALHWLMFTMIDKPAINGVQETSTAMLGVTWSLRFEWVFYLLLPVGALTLGMRVRWPLLIVGLLMLAFCFIAQPPWIHFAAFGFGIVAAHVSKNPALRAFAASAVASLVVIGCAVLAVWWSPRGDRLPSLTLFGLAFVLIAAGTSLFGVLRGATLRLLGDMSYSVYLLHSLVLYCVFTFIIGRPASQAMSAAGHWAVAAICTPPLVIICYCSYRFIELPGMAAVPRVQARVKVWQAWLEGLLSPSPR